MSFIERFTDSVGQFFEKNPHKVQLTLTAVAASALTATTILSYQTTQRRLRAKNLKDELREAETRNAIDLTPLGTANIRRLNKKTTSALSPNTVFDDSLIQEQLGKNTAFLGETKARRVREAFVVIVGAGGVGSWAALMLLRSGVRKIRIIDFDQVTLSSLNRHAVATLEDVGTPKVQAIKKHFNDIAPFVEVEPCIDLLNAENVDELLGGNPDYVVDAIDNINTKIDLIKYCYEKKLKVISSMGAGAKADPSRIQIADISETFEDPLARAVRRKLKKLGILNGVPVTYSTEVPHHVKLLPLEEEKIEDREQFSALPDFRARILPVLGTIPSMFGVAIATYVMLNITEYPDFNPLAVKLREGLYSRVHREVMIREEKTFNENNCLLDIRDVAYIYEEMYHGKSVISGPNDKLSLTRWDKSKPLTSINAVCMTKTEANKHDTLPGNTNLEDHYGKDVYDNVIKHFEHEKQVQKIWNRVL